MTYATHLSIWLQTEDDTKRSEQDKKESAEDLWPEKEITELGDIRPAAIRNVGEKHHSFLNF